MGSSTFIGEYLRSGISDEELERILAQCNDDTLESEAAELDVLPENLAAQPGKDAGPVRPEAA